MPLHTNTDVHPTVGDGILDVPQGSAIRYARDGAPYIYIISSPYVGATLAVALAYII